MSCVVTSSIWSPDYTNKPTRALYWYGDECISFSGGWRGRAVISGGQNIAGNLVKESQALHLTATGGFYDAQTMSPVYLQSGDVIHVIYTGTQILCQTLSGDGSNENQYVGILGWNTTGGTQVEVTFTMPSITAQNLYVTFATSKGADPNGIYIYGAWIER